MPCGGSSYGDRFNTENKTTLKTQPQAAPIAEARIDQSHS